MNYNELKNEIKDLDIETRNIINELYDKYTNEDKINKDEIKTIMKRLFSNKYIETNNYNYQIPIGFIDSILGKFLFSIYYSIDKKIYVGSVVKIVQEGGLITVDSI